MKALKIGDIVYHRSDFPNFKNLFVVKAIRNSSVICFRFNHNGSMEELSFSRIAIAISGKVKIPDSAVFLDQVESEIKKGLAVYLNGFDKCFIVDESGVDGKGNINLVYYWDGMISEEYVLLPLATLNAPASSLG